MAELMNTPAKKAVRKKVARKKAAPRRVSQARREELERNMVKTVVRPPEMAPQTPQEPPTEAQRVYRYIGHGQRIIDGQRVVHGTQMNRLPSEVTREWEEVK